MVEENIITGTENLQVESDKKNNRNHLRFVEFDM